jgi:hypothetical protein
MNIAQFYALDDSEQAAILDKADAAILALPGLTPDHGSTMVLECDGYEDDIYIKMMSCHGVTDDANGLALQAYLNSKGIGFDSSRNRSMGMKLSDFLSEFCR